MTPKADTIWPTQLRFSTSQGLLSLDWDDGASGQINYRALRASSPSAQNIYKSPQDVPADIQVERAEHVGRYAVRIFFSDGHNSGLYRWKLLKDLSARND